jgi:lysophospholipase L1-like esterase
MRAVLAIVISALAAFSAGIAVMDFGARALTGYGVTMMGDSFTVHGGASDAAHGYATKFSDFVGGTLDNQGVSGTGTITAAKNALAAMVVNRKRLATVLAGFNDIGRTGVAAYDKIKANHRSIIAAAFLREAVPASAMTATGTWTALGNGLGGKAFALGGTPLYTTDPGAYLEWEFFGETLVVGAYIQEASGSYKDFNVSIDGAAPVVYQSLGLNDETYPSSGFNALVFKNLGFGRHTVRVSDKSGAGVYTVVDYVGTLIDPAAAVGLLVGEVPTRTQWTYNGNTINQAITEDASAAIASVVAEFSEWPVRMVPVSDFYTPADVGSDGYHPNDAGHKRIFQAFKSQVSLW